MTFARVTFNMIVIKKMLSSFAIIILLFTTCSNSEEDINLREARDTYIDAYTESHGGSANLQKINGDDREYTEPSYSYPPTKPNFQYGPPISGPSAPAGPIRPIKYGYAPSAYPINHHFPPSAPVYGPPPYQPYNEMPHGMLGILDKIKMKIDLFTIGKILLKLVIFKKIVGLIAILCLLLFIPSLKHKFIETDVGGDHNGDDDDEERGFNLKNYKSSGLDNSVTTFVLEAIENFSKNITRDETDDDDKSKCDGDVVCSSKILSAKDKSQKMFIKR